MLTPDEAKERAIDATGLSDFGGDDFEDGLAAALESFASLPLNEVGRASSEAAITGSLAARLRVQEYWSANPELAATDVEGPLLVTGLPRTGTTATVAMLALDSRFRFLRAWEAIEPMPPPVLGEETNDPRAIRARQAESGGLDQALHLADPDGPEEDLVYLAGLTMRAYHGAFPMRQNFIDWWTSADFACTYKWHRRVLQILHSRRPPHLWLLKAPPHLFHLEAFVAEYPGARIIMTHRDPASVIPSDCSLRWSLAAHRCDMADLDKKDFGPRLLAFWKQGMDRAMVARSRIGEDRFVDVRNADVIAAPVAALEQTYTALDLEMTPDLRAAIGSYREQHAKGAHGEHQYTPEEYGLTRELIRETFGEYIARFDL